MRFIPIRAALVAFATLLLLVSTGYAEDGGSDEGDCTSYTGGDLKEGCDYSPASFGNWETESEYGPGDREGGLPDENPSDGGNCIQYEIWYWMDYNCG